MAFISRFQDIKILLQFIAVVFIHTFFFRKNFQFVRLIIFYKNSLIQCVFAFFVIWYQLRPVWSFIFRFHNASYFTSFFPVPFRSKWFFTINRNVQYWTWHRYINFVSPFFFQWINSPGHYVRTKFLLKWISKFLGVFAVRLKYSYHNIYKIH